MRNASLQPRHVARIEAAWRPNDMLSVFGCRRSPPADRLLLVTDWLISGRVGRRAVFGCGQPAS